MGIRKRSFISRWRVWLQCGCWCFSPTGPNMPPPFGDPGRKLRHLLSALQMPKLVIHGEEDRLVPVEAGCYLADHIPGAQLNLFKDLGHVPMFTATAEFAQVVRNFIRTGRPT